MACLLEEAHFQLLQRLWSMATDTGAASVYFLHDNLGCIPYSNFPDSGIGNNTKPRLSYGREVLYFTLAVSTAKMTVLG